MQSEELALLQKYLLTADILYLLLSKGKTPAVSAQWWLCGIGDRGDRDLSVCHLFFFSAV